MRSNLTRELRSLGVDAFDAGAERDTGARYLLKVIDADAKSTNEVAGDAPSGPTKNVLITAMHATVNLELRLYDANSMALLRTYEIHHSGPDDAPIFGAGTSGRLGAWFLRPFYRRSTMRAAARSAAREAALKITSQ